MPSLSEKDRESLERLIEAVEKIEFFAQNFKDATELESNEVYLDAILMNFIVIGSCVARLSESSKNAYSSIPWHKITGLRNIVAHDYWGVDVEMTWQIIQNTLPSFKNDIRKIFSE